MNDGWIKLYRKMQQWGWYKDANTKSVFIHLLFNANYEPSTYMGYDIKVGDCIFGINRFSQDLNISAQSIRTAIKRLKSTGEITVKSTNKFSIITLVNYSSFQNEQEQSNNQDNTQSNNQLTINQQSTNNQLTTSKKEKNIRNKEIKKYNIYHENVKLTDEEYEKLVEQFEKADADERIERLSMYLFSSGKKYQSHYHTILNWARSDKLKANPQQKASKTDYMKPATYADERNDTFE